MEMKSAYAFGKSVETPHAETAARLRDVLAGEGFGIISETDLKEKFAEKLQKEFRNYLILGACNPSLAYEFLSREIDLGTFLPCNVVVYDRDDGRTAVMAFDPVAVFALAGRPEITGYAEKAAEKLKRVIASI
jgi:uncharacterized protein (DUF302 family)